MELIQTFLFEHSLMMGRLDGTKCAGWKTFLAIIAQGGVDKYRFPGIDSGDGFNCANCSCFTWLAGLADLPDHAGFDQSCFPLPIIPKII